MKFCIECRHCNIPEDGKTLFSTCLKASKPDYITGKAAYWYCTSVRESTLTEDCGPEARHFAPKLKVTP